MPRFRLRYEVVAMQMVDFNQYVQNQRMYGGTAGRKMGIVYKGRNYILKFPGNLKEQKMKNIQLSPIALSVSILVRRFINF